MARTVTHFLTNPPQPSFGIAPACTSRVGDPMLIAAGFDVKVTRIGNARLTTALATRGAG